MVRITRMAVPGDAVELKLEGRLIGPWVEELRGLCEEVLTGRGRLALDLKDVTFMDPRGVALLRSLREREVALRNCSPFSAAQLKGEDHG